MVIVLDRGGVEELPRLSEKLPTLDLVDSRDRKRADERNFDLGRRMARCRELCLIEMMKRSLEIAATKAHARESELNPDPRGRLAHRWAIPRPKKLHADRRWKIREPRMVVTHPAHPFFDRCRNPVCGEDAAAPRSTIPEPSSSKAPEASLDAGNVFDEASLRGKMGREGSDRATLGDQRVDVPAPVKARGMTLRWIGGRHMEGHCLGGKA